MPPRRRQRRFSAKRRSRTSSYRRRPARFATKYGRKKKTFRRKTSSKIRNIRRVVPRVPRKNLKLYQTWGSLEARSPDEGAFGTTRLLAELDEGVHDYQRIGTNIVIWRIDIRWYMEPEYGSTIPEENVRVMLYRTKEIMSDGPPSNYSSMFLRPGNSIPGQGLSPATGGSDGEWPAKLWAWNPVYDRKWSLEYCRDFVMNNYPPTYLVSGAPPVPATQATAVLTVNAATPRKVRRMGRIAKRYPKGMRVLFFRDDAEVESFYITPRKQAIDNQPFLAVVGESIGATTTIGCLQLFYHADIWFTDN